MVHDFDEASEEGYWVFRGPCKKHPTEARLTFIPAANLTLEGVVPYTEWLRLDKPGLELVRDQIRSRYAEMAALRKE